MSLYTPHLMRIEEVRRETPDVKSFKLRFLDPAVAERFTFRAGQFGLYSAFGEGESTFCIASPPTWRDHIECTFRAVGKVTDALSKMEEGDVIGFRGPYGNSFPIESFEGKDLLFVIGGIALPPLRCVIWNVLDLRDRFGAVRIVYGARSVADLVYKDELEMWEERPDVELVTTVDPGGETSDWKGKVGFVPTVLDQVAPPSKNSLAFVCGPPIMIKYSMPILDKLGFAPTEIYTTLENRMKCGVGKCGRCNIGGTYVCKEGPVFTAEEMLALPMTSDY
ncbi:MAG: heterodisulfide reductase subunit F [Candidatus Eisenbacteria bacterium]|nr:heterodisulfide reductase subunit F [Candidatus Eisenbacteria bacterium]